MDTYTAVKKVPQWTTSTGCAASRSTWRPPTRTPLGGDWLETSLDPRTLALVRLGAVAAMGGCAVTSYGALTDDALAAGASVGDVVDVLFGVLPIVGTARVVAAAPGLALALGHDLDDVPGA